MKSDITYYFIAVFLIISAAYMIMGTRPGADVSLNRQQVSVSPENSPAKRPKPEKNIDPSENKKRENTAVKPVNTVSYSIPGAISTGKETGLPVLVLFYNNFNTLSKKFYNDILNSQSVFNTLKSRGPLCLIDCDRRAGDMKKYSVWHIPTVMIISPEGRELKRLEKYESLEEFLQWVRENRKAVKEK